MIDWNKIEDRLERFTDYIEIISCVLVVLAVSLLLGFAVYLCIDSLPAEPVVTLTNTRMCEVEGIRFIKVACNHD